MSWKTARIHWWNSRVTLSHFAVRAISVVTVLGGQQCCLSLYESTHQLPKNIKRTRLTAVAGDLALKEQKDEGGETQAHELILHAAHGTQEPMFTPFLQRMPDKMNNLH